MKKWWWKIALALLLLSWPLLTMILMPDKTYYDYVASLVLANVCIAVGLGILMGYTGLVSLGQAGFVAMGAYTVGILISKAGFDLLSALLVAAILCALTGFTLGLTAVRLKSTYLVLVTLGFGASIPHLLVYFHDLTGGHNGLQVAGATLLGLPITSGKQFYYIILGVVSLLVWCAFNLTRSKKGRTFRAVRDSEIAAQSLGINLMVTRATAFAVSAVYAGVAGGLLAPLLGYLGAEDYNIMASLNYLIMVIIGGASSLWGVMLGALFFVVAMELFSNSPAGMTLVFFGGAVIATMMLLPRGLASLPAVLSKKRGALRGR
ncbi:MAG: branched-chain amino acid ABC transporter permease [Thermodesulfobacteriota bacterium]